MPDILLRTNYYPNSENHPTKRCKTNPISGIDDERRQKIQSSKQHTCCEREQR
jgi:hypothetical protein